MTPGRSTRTTISIQTAVRRSGLSKKVVHECVMREIVTEPLTDDDLRELRRVRRLQDLGINLPGIEAIIHMRQQILALRAELDRVQRLFGYPQWQLGAEWRALPPPRKQHGSES